MLQDQSSVPYELRDQRFFLVKEVPQGRVALCPKAMDPTRAVLVPCNDLGVVADGAQPIGLPVSHVFGTTVFPAAMGAEERKQRLVDFLLHEYSRDHACEARRASPSPFSPRARQPLVPNLILHVHPAQENYQEAREGFLRLITGRLTTKTSEGTVIDVKGPFSRTLFLSVVRAKFLHWQRDKKRVGKWDVWPCPPHNAEFGKRVLLHMLQITELPTKSKDGVTVGLGAVLHVAYNDAAHAMRVRARVTIL